MSEDTPRSLLQRLRSNQDASDWRRMVEIYTPLIRRWLSQYGVSEADADDFIQEVFHTVLREIDSFAHNGQRGAFRRWLRTTLVNRLRGFWRSRQRDAVTGGDSDKILADLEDQSSDPNLLWDREHDQFVVRRLLELVQTEFTPSTWQAFQRQVMDGARAPSVAEELGISTNAVLIAKSRVLRRLREEVQGLVDQGSML